MAWRAYYEQNDKQFYAFRSPERGKLEKLDKHITLYKNRGEIVGFSIAGSFEFLMNYSTSFSMCEKLEIVRGLLNMLWRNAPPKVKKMCKGYSEVQDFFLEILNDVQKSRYADERSREKLKEIMEQE